MSPERLRSYKRRVVAYDILDTEPPFEEGLQEYHLLIESHIRIAEDAFSLHKVVCAAMRRAGWRTPDEVEPREVLQQELVGIPYDNRILRKSLLICRSNPRVYLDCRNFAVAPELAVPTYPCVEVQNLQSCTLNRYCRSII